jgi:hypothetical protein
VQAQQLNVTTLYIHRSSDQEIGKKERSESNAHISFKMASLMSYNSKSLQIYNHNVPHSETGYIWYCPSYNLGFSDLTKRYCFHEKATELKGGYLQIGCSYNKSSDTQDEDFARAQFHRFMVCSNKCSTYECTTF